MNSQLKTALVTYAQSFLACVITVMVSLNLTPFTMTKADLVKVANAVWASFLPVIAKALNPNDTSIGIGTNE